MDKFAYGKTFVCYLMLKRKRPLNGCFKNTMTPDTPVIERNLGSRPKKKKKKLWRGKPNPQNLTHNRKKIKNAVSEAAVYTKHLRDSQEC